MAQVEFAREVVTGGLTALPKVNSRLSIIPGGDEEAAFGQVVEVPTRVEDLHLRLGDRRSPGAEIVIAQPMFAGNVHGEVTGTRYVLRWVTERGVHEVTGRYLGRRRVGPVLVGWRLGIVGPVTRVQRRAHARVDLAVPVELAPVSVEPGVKGAAPVESASLGPASLGPASPEPGVGGCGGITVNVSEGGLLALLPGAAPGDVPPVGNAVIARFGVGGEVFELAARVVRHQAAPRGADAGTAVALAFDSPDRHGDRLRPLLFAHQLRARRAGVV